MLSELPASWLPILAPIWEKHGPIITAFLDKEKETFEGVLEIYPPRDQIFEAFRLCPFDEVRVVIIGMDPYINAGEAHGLAFSTLNSVAPPSLRNIFKELEREYGSKPGTTNLTFWAKQGVLLLNTALTVRQGSSGSHTAIWREFTKELVEAIGQSAKHTVFMLWGAHAQAFECYLVSDENLMLKHSHPSPLSRKPFVGCAHFSKANEFLGPDKAINWI